MINSHVFPLFCSKPEEIRTYIARLGVDRPGEFSMGHKKMVKMLAYTTPLRGKGSVCLLRVKRGSGWVFIACKACSWLEDMARCLVIYGSW